MKITKKYLQRIINEEIQKILSEDMASYPIKHADPQEEPDAYGRSMQRTPEEMLGQIFGQIGTSGPNWTQRDYDGLARDIVQLADGDWQMVQTALATHGDSIGGIGRIIGRHLAILDPLIKAKDPSFHGFGDVGGAGTGDRGGRETSRFGVSTRRTGHDRSMP